MKLDKDRSSKQLGACVAADGATHFLVWAPAATTVTLHCEGPYRNQIPMQADGEGYFSLVSREATEGTLYKFSLNGDAPLPDPASRLQASGVHGPSTVVSSSFAWSDHAWKGFSSPKELVIYELHVGCFSALGTFAGVLEQLGRLKELGVTAIEIMPVAQFPGQRNWGYDGVFPFAVQHSYGGPGGLKELVNACHSLGLGVILDVVYNHLGPEGNYLPQFGPYFQDRYRTPWGEAINFDGPAGDHVRHYFLQNALQWLDEFHCDGLRLDAVHAICDLSARPFIEELALAKAALEQKTGRFYCLIAESDANDCRILTPLEWGGAGLDGQWMDDFHHCLHALLTGERLAYYADYGDPEQMARALENGVVYEGEYSAFRRRRHGRPYQAIKPEKLVVCAQNHDQIGNRSFGERLSQLLDFERLKLAAGFLMLSPFVPLLFMGEEYGEERPFLYFIDHTDPALREAVCKGRRAEFAGMHGQEEPPDPGSLETFQRSTLNPRQRQERPNSEALWFYYQALIALSKWIRQNEIFDGDSYRVAWHAVERVIVSRGEQAGIELACYFSLNQSFTKLPGDGSTVGRILIRSSDYQGGANLAELRENEARALGKIQLGPFEAMAVRLEGRG